jgi:hypothetical protein
VTSGYDDLERLAKEAGADGRMAKPLDLKELVDTANRFAETRAVNDTQTRRLQLNKPWQLIGKNEDRYRNAIRQDGCDPLAKHGFEMKLTVDAD